MTSRVVHYNIPIDDSERAGAFYGSVFGWKATRWGPMDYWTITAGDEPGPAMVSALGGRFAVDDDRTIPDVIEGMFQFAQDFLVAFDIHQHVMCLVNFLDRVSQLAASPVFQTVDLAAFGSDQRAITLDHRGHLLALIGMHNKHDFVMSHYISLWLSPPLAVRWSKVCGTAHNKFTGTASQGRAL